MQRRFDRRTQVLLVCMVMEQSSDIFRKQQWNLKKAQNQNMSNTESIH